MLKSTEVLEIAQKVNPKVNIPFFGEAVEEAILCGIIVTIDVTLVNLGFNLDELLSDPSEGITTEEKENIVSLAVAELNPKINVPIVGEAEEALFFSLIINYIIDFILAKVKAKTSGNESQEV